MKCEESEQMFVETQRFHMLDIEHPLIESKYVNLTV